MFVPADVQVMLFKQLLLRPVVTEDMPMTCLQRRPYTCPMVRPTARKLVARPIVRTWPYCLRLALLSELPTTTFVMPMRTLTLLNCLLSRSKRLLIIAGLVTLLTVVKVLLLVLVTSPMAPLVCLGMTLPIVIPMFPDVSSRVMVWLTFRLVLAINVCRLP